MRSWASDLRRYACGGDGGDGGVALGGLPGGAWVVALSHKNHDLHLYIRCCDLVLMEIPRHSSHKIEPITPWPPELPQLTRQAIPPSPISLQHPCPGSRQTMPIMGLSESCRRTTLILRKRRGTKPFPFPPTRKTRPAGNQARIRLSASPLWITTRPCPH